MAETRAAMLRRLWLTVHLWIGVGLAVLLVPISLSGALLVFGDAIDATIAPQRYAVSGATLLPPAAYLANAAAAAAALPGQPRPSGLRYPEHRGAPVRVLLRDAAHDGSRPRLVIAYLDPPTARVLDIADFRATFVGIVHGLHENLMLPLSGGRQIVGWTGVGLLTLALTGLWLWWPRNGGALRGLRWRRSPRVTANLHHLFGFWIALPLAVVAATGIYLGFPQTAREATSALAPMAPRPPRLLTAPMRHTALSPDSALAIAQAAAPDGRPLALFLPGAHDGAWRVQLARPAGDDITVVVDDRSGSAAPALAPQSGDRVARTIRALHEGSRGGSLWKSIVFLTGLLPTVFVVTGVTMWLRKRADRRALAPKRAAVLRPAE